MAFCAAARHLIIIPLLIAQGSSLLLHQLIAPGLLHLLPIWVISSCPGETDLLHMPTQHNLPHLFNQLILLCLHGTPWVIILVGLSHLLVQPGLPPLTVWPMLHLHAMPGLHLLLVLVSLLLLIPVLVHWFDQHACSLPSLCPLQLTWALL